jgi:hypothetical protein
LDNEKCFPIRFVSTLFDPKAAFHHFCPSSSSGSSSTALFEILRANTHVLFFRRGFRRAVCTLVEECKTHHRLCRREEGPKPPKLPKAAAPKPNDDDASRRPEKEEDDDRGESIVVVAAARGGEDGAKRPAEIYPRARAKNSLENHRAADERERRRTGESERTSARIHRYVRRLKKHHQSSTIYIYIFSSRAFFVVCVVGLRCAMTKISFRDAARRKTPPPFARGGGPFFGATKR